MVRKDCEKLFSLLKPPQPPDGLFDRIVFAIKREQELRHTKKLLFGFLSLLLASLFSVPFSGAMLIKQIENSGIFYFIFAVINDWQAFFAVWQDFGLAILGSLPIGGLTSFFLSIAVSVFTLRLFLRRRKMLLGYLIKNFV